MKYMGRITGLIIMLMTIIAVRLYAYIYLDYSFSNPPYPGMIGLLIAYWAGKQYDKVKFYSEKDSLTGLYNRRFIDELLPALLTKMDRKNEKLSIAILDCDNFKVINDQYGHRKGDLVLQELSALLLTSIRKGDIAARWGGDEFLIIAPCTGDEEIKQILKRFNNELLELSRKMQITISLSSGYAIYPSDTKRIEDLISIADSKMYRLKDAARS